MCIRDRLGTTLNKNNLKVALLGNSDIKKNDDLKKIRNLALVCMDENGRVQSGNVDNINKKDDTMPFGISTDYDKLKSETKKYYENNDAIFVELGDTYRLDAVSYTHLLYYKGGFFDIQIHK